MDAAQAGRITTLVIVFGTSVVWLAFWFARWLNVGLNAAREEFERDQAEQQETARALAAIWHAQQEEHAHHNARQRW